MTTITISKEAQHKKGELVAIPKADYNEYLSYKKSFPIYTPTKTEIRDLERARKDIKAGNFIEWSKLRNELGAHRQKPRGKRS